MSEHYDFHYQPTGSGAISGQQVLEQTEDAINELGDYVNNNVGGAMDVAQQALETAQNAEQDAQTALDTANSFSSAIQSAQQDASTALSTAQTAQTTASNANNTAIQAQQDANTAVTTANNASGQVSTLSGTVTTLGQRVTTAEGNIGQNTSDITALTTRVGTAEGNITTLQNDVSIAQGNASSAMATAGQVKQQAFVFRYSSTALTASSTNSNTLLDNTDNLKVGDKVIDSDGVLFSITAIDNENSTFTIGSALIDLALDANVVHTSGNETISGTKTLDNVNLPFKNTAELGVSGGSTNITFSDKNGQLLCALKAITYSSGVPSFHITLTQKVDNTIYTTNGIALYQQTNSKVIQVRPTLANDNADGLSVWLGSSLNTFSRIYGLAYYYGNDNVEFSTKFVTTDTAQTISGVKTFSDNPLVGNSNTNITISNRQITANGSASTTGNHAYSYMQLQAKVNYADSSSPMGVTVGLDINEDAYADGKRSSLSPNSNNLTNLGKSGKRWANVYATNYYYGSSEVEFSTKFVTTDTAQTISGNKTFSSINGVEPSSLSLPVAPSSTSYVDISSYITVLDSSSANTYTPPSNGYITFAVTGNLVQIFHDYGLQGKWSVQAGNANRGFIPVLGGVEVKIYITASNIDKFWFIPCQGNI